MKRKDLTAYIREQIINELTEAGEKTAMVTTQSGETSAIDYTTSDQLNKLKDNSDIKSIKTGAGQKIKEADLDEMARKAGSYRPGSKFEDAKEIYTTGLFAELLKAIEEAGENGVTQKELGSILSRGDGSSLNLILKNLRTVGILSGGPLAAAPKPEKDTKEEEPEDMEDTDIEDTDMEDMEDMEDTEEPETEEEPEEEETPEEEPVTTTKASDDLGKWADELAKLNTKKDDLLKKLKSKEITMDQYKEMIGNIPAQIKALQAKIDRYSE